MIATVIRFSYSSEGIHKHQRKLNDSGHRTRKHSVGFIEREKDFGMYTWQCFIIVGTEGFMETAYVAIVASALLFDLKALELLAL